MKYNLLKIMVIATVLAMFFTLFAQDRSPERIAREHLAAGDSLFTTERDFTGAIESYRQALNLFKELNSDVTPYNLEIRRALNNLYIAGQNARNWEITTRYGEELLLMEPSNEAVVRQLAQIYRVGMNDIPRAIAVWVRYDESFDSFLAKQEIADLYGRNNDTQNAIIWYQRALEMNKDADLLNKLALLYENNNQPDRAIEVYNDFIASEPSRRQLGIAYKNMGTMYQNMNNLNLAIQNYERSLEIDFDRQVSLWLVMQYFDRGNFERANHHIDIMISRSANDNDAIFYKAQILFADGRFAEARPLFQRLTSHATYGRDALRFIEIIDSSE